MHTWYVLLYHNCRDLWKRRSIIDTLVSDCGAAAPRWARWEIDHTGSHTDSWVEMNYLDAVIYHQWIPIKHRCPEYYDDSCKQIPCAFFHYIVLLRHVHIRILNLCNDIPNFHFILSMHTSKIHWAGLESITQRNLQDSVVVGPDWIVIFLCPNGNRMEIYIVYQC